MSDLDSALKDFLRTTRSMESNIVSVISDSNRDIEMILKELLIYLDATSKNLDKVQGSVVEFIKEYEQDQSSVNFSKEVDNMVKTIKVYHDRIIEVEIDNTKKILDFVRQVGSSNQKLLKQIFNLVSNIYKKDEALSLKMEESSEDLDEIKGLLKTITRELDETKNNVSKNQDNLMTVISNMMDSESQRMAATGQVESQKIKSDEEKAKAKLALIGKIVGVVLGSGGIVYLIIDILLKAAAGG